MAKPQRVAYFKANLQDKPGVLLQIMKELKAKNLGLSGLWGFSTQGGQAELYVVPKSPDKLRALWSSAGRLADEGTAFWLKGADRTGVLVKSLEALAGAGINIEAIDAIAVGGKYGSCIWVNPSDVDKAAKALGI